MVLSNHIKVNLTHEEVHALAQSEYYYRKRQGNIMVTLINLIVVGNLIKTNYFSDHNDKDQGYIEYDMEKKKVVLYYYSQEDKDSKIKYDFSKAIWAIEKLIEYNKFPEKYRYIWY